MDEGALRYRCLVLDHDDTVMDSTRTLHYPAFCKGMAELRPEVHLSLEEFFLINFRPGIRSYYLDVVKLDEREYRREFEIWQDCVQEKVPPVYAGMARIIRRQRELGGYVCVSSHSVSRHIFRDYAANGLPAPDLVYGWDLPEEQRKPAAYALEDIMARLSLEREELVVIDDLPFGCQMAHRCGVTAIGAGWGYDIGEIERHMRRCCDGYCKTQEELEALLFI